MENFVNHKDEMVCGNITPKLIRVTSCVNGRPVYINTSHIESVEVSQFDDVKIICSHEYYWVKERIDDILLAMSD